MRARAGTRRSTGAVDLEIDAPVLFFSPALSLSLSVLNRDEQVVAAAVCSPRGCVRKRRLSEVVVGSVGDVVAQARVKATTDGDGGFPVYCGGGSDVSGEPANEGA